MPSSRIHSEIVLRPKDTGNHSRRCGARGQGSHRPKGAQFIVGPLFSQSVSTVAPIAREHHINILSFSNNKAVAAEGVYLFGFLPEQQVARVADYAFLHNLTRVALLAPNDAYGQKLRKHSLRAIKQKAASSRRWNFMRRALPISTRRCCASPTTTPPIPTAISRRSSSPIRGRCLKTSSLP